mgnify:FL=1
MRDPNPLNVYYCPWNSDDSGSTWDMMYQTPTSLFEDFKERANKQNKDDSVLHCPASSSIIKNTFVFKNSLHSEYAFTDNSVTPISTNFISLDGMTYERQLSLINTRHIVLNYSYLFFSEEPLLMSLVPPYWHEPAYTKTATLFSGEFDIGQWFRPISSEFMTWKTEGTLVLEEDEPLFYTQFHTDRKVNLQRFKATPTLYNYALECKRSPIFYGKRKSLKERYLKFNKSDLRELVLFEIKQNLV